MRKGIEGVPLKDVAAPLRDLWLRFHQANLCLGIDAVFVFQPGSLEVWCRIKEERDYQQLNSWVAPLLKSFPIELYPTRADRERKPYSPEDDDPPPSFWNNGELRTFMRDPNFSRGGVVIDDMGGLSSQPSVDPGLKRRLKLYADETLELAGKTEHLAADLPALADAAFDEGLISDVRSRARGICLDHVRETSKCARQLEDNLKHAFPQPDKKAQPVKAQPMEIMTSATPYQSVLDFSEQARDVARRIFHFIYPQAHTVDLTDLKKPSLLEALRMLQQSASALVAGASKGK